VAYLSDSATGSDAAPDSARAHGWRQDALDWLGQRRRALLGGLAVTVAAVALFTRFSVDMLLSRDEAIYVYGSIRFAHGVAPYASIFDPKTPGATLLGGFAAHLATLQPASALHAIRAEFFVVALLAVLAVYVLALELSGSVGGAITAGVAFCCYTRFAQDALGGPDPKTAGVLFMVLCMWLLVRRRWFAGGVMGGLAFLFWQPLMWFPLIAVVAAAVYSAPHRRRRGALVAAGGAAAPVAVVAIYFALAGAFSDFVRTAFIFPLVGTVRAPETLGQHLTRIPGVLWVYPLTAAVFCVGTACLVLAVVLRLRSAPAREVLMTPLVLIVAATFVLNLLYALYDFQWTPDTLPFMPYPVLGAAVLIGELQGRVASVAVGRVVAAAGVVLALVGASVAWAQYQTPTSKARNLSGQLSSACGLSRLVGTGSFVELGDPTQLVLTGRTSTSPFIYLDAGVDQWKVDHTAGGLQGWLHEILAQHPPVIGLDGWYTPITPRMKLLLRKAGYVHRFIGPWRVFIAPAARLRSRAVNVLLSTHPTPIALTRQHRRLPAQVPCPPTSSAQGR
jgi:hypothetical protein